MQILGLCAFLLAVAHGCGGEEDLSPLVCDGSEGRTLQVRSTIGSELFPEAAPALAINGRCEYWIRSLLSHKNGKNFVPWPATRFGKLTPAEAHSVAKRLEFASWDGMAGVWRNDGYTYHYPNTIFSNGRSVVVCEAECKSSTTPPALARVMGNVDFVGPLYKVLDELWAKGSYIGPPYLIKVFDVRGIQVGLNRNDPVVNWDLSLNIDDVASPWISHTPHKVTLVGAGDDAVKLADLRARLANDEWRSDFVPMKRPETVFPPDRWAYEYQLYMRDVFPFENSEGRISDRW